MGQDFLKSGRGQEWRAKSASLALVELANS